MASGAALRVSEGTCSPKPAASSFGPHTVTPSQQHTADESQLSRARPPRPARPQLSPHPVLGWTANPSPPCRWFWTMGSRRPQQGLRGSRP